MNSVKSSQLLIDNATLQHMGELFANGLQGDNDCELVVSPEQNCFSYKSISADARNAKCLFQMLNHLVFADSALVEKKQTGAWSEYDELMCLTREGFVIPEPFHKYQEKWKPISQRFIDELCVCPAMREQHERNVQSFKATQQSEDRAFSMIIWGGAGMLARAHLLGIPYCGHPAREALFGQISSLFGQRSAEKRFRQFVSEQRVKVLRRVDSGGYLARLHLPPVAALIIQEANKPDDLLKIAFQLRERYASLRQWLREFQAALDAGDVSDQLKREKILESVALNIDAKCSAFPTSPEGDTTIQIGLEWLNASVNPAGFVNKVINLIGVRALMNRLVLAPAGANVVRKLAELFGEKNSALGRDLEFALLQSSETDQSSG